MRAPVASLSLLVLAACAHHAAVSIQVTGWEYERAGAVPSAVVLRLSNPGQAKQQLRLEPVAANGTGLAADTPCAPILQPEATTIIACRLPDEGKTMFAEPLKFVAYDDDKHQIGSSCAFMLVPRNGGFVNPGLQQWEKSDPNAPAGWLNSGGTRLGFMRHERILGVQAMYFNVPDSRKWSNGGWNSMWLRQYVPAVPMRLTVRLYPEQPLERTGFPETFFGVDVIDSQSHEAYFGIDPGLTAPATYRRPNTTIYAFPGKLHAWNTIAIDTSQLAGQDKFNLGPGQKLEFKAVSGKMSASKAQMSGAFGGLSVDTRAAGDPCTNAHAERAGGSFAAPPAERRSA